MKTFFNGIPIYLIERLPFNYGEIEAQKAINDVFDNLEEDSNVTYNPDFVKEMNEIKKEKPVPMNKYEDLFDDE